MKVSELWKLYETDKRIQGFIHKMQEQSIKLP